MYEDLFLYEELTAYDQVVFATSLKFAHKLLGRKPCWCMKLCNHNVFQGFTTSKKNRLLYKTKDARPLLLALAGKFSTEEKSIIVRKAECTSQYCLNPSHYYWGTRSDVAYENAKRSNSNINNLLITKLREKSQKGISKKELSITYKIPYETTRRICNYEIYEEVVKEIKDGKIWKTILANCRKINSAHSSEAKKFNLNYHVTNALECPWGHQGKFGSMGECLTCMEEIKKGRCMVDLREFPFRWYWQVKRFWEQVDIKKSDDCWVWQGATRKNNTESTAYFPSPFHSSKIQSASRVAFWLSRGYTGRYRIFSRSTCKAFCCNPEHLTIKELKCSPTPKLSGTIRLSHDNIFEYHKKKQAGKQNS